MTTIDKSHVDNAIIKGEIGEAIKMMLALFQANNGSDYDNVVLQSARWHGLQREIMSGVISPGNAQMVTNKIAATVKHYAGNIQSGWTAQYDLKNTPVSPAPMPQNGSSANSLNNSQDDQTKVILFVSANPKNTDPLKFGIELRSIENSLNLGIGRDNYVLVAKTAATIKDFRQALLNHKPNIIHFAGHGTPEGEIILHNAVDRGQEVSAEAMGNFFKLASQIADIECVVMSACFSGQQANIIAEHVGCVMGMRGAIEDDSAINFSATVYQVLVSGQDYKTAFDFAKSDLEMQGLQGQDLPVYVNKK